MPTHDKQPIVLTLAQVQQLKKSHELLGKILAEWEQAEEQRLRTRPVEEENKWPDGFTKVAEIREVLARLYQEALGDDPSSHYPVPHRAEVTVMDAIANQWGEVSYALYMTDSAHLKGPIVFDVAVEPDGKLRLHKADGVDDPEDLGPPETDADVEAYAARSVAEHRDPSLYFKRAFPEEENK